MAFADFFSKESRARAKQAVETIESRTAAEIVIVVRKRCAAYREARLTGALIGGFAMLVWVIFSPARYAAAGLPLRVAAAAAAVGALAAWLSPLERALLSKESMRQATRAAARAAFVDLGVSKTKGRTGVLVMVAMLERRVELVCDVGVDASVLAEAEARLEAAIARLDFAELVRALESMAAPLAKALPRQPDDENELPDEVVE